jgi:hypothetical protein
MASILVEILRPDNGYFDRIWIAFLSPTREVMEK